MGSSNETSFFGPVINPWRRAGSDTKLVPGGSSGGSAAAVAAGLCLGATATDTGGSIRQPAAFTGTVGIKPTYGRCSRWGTVAFASSLDQAGPMAAPSRDAAILLRSMAGYDPKDSTSVDPSAGLRQRRRQVGEGHEDRHSQGIPRRRHAGRDREALAAGHRLAEGRRLPRSSTSRCRTPNTRCRPITSWRPPKPRRTSPAMTACATACASMADLTDMYESTRAAGFGDEVKRRIMIGTYVLSAGYYDAYYLKAQKVRTLIKRDFDQAFQKVGV
jgi:aspartyl-tRNA(Asn)/glutamyl-tRNA(Gln) amidotransferase subunit A